MKNNIPILGLILCVAIPAFAKKGRYAKITVSEDLQKEVKVVCKADIAFDFSEAWPGDSLLDGDKVAVGSFASNMLQKACQENASKVSSALKKVSFVTPETGNLDAAVSGGKLVITLPMSDSDGLIAHWGWSDNEKVNPVIRKALRKGLGLKLLTEEEEKESQKAAQEAAEKATERAEVEKSKSRALEDQKKQAALNKKQEAQQNKAAQITKDFQEEIIKIQKEKASDPQGMAAAIEAAQRKLEKRLSD